MKPQQLYQELKDLAEKMGIAVSEQNLKISGFPVQSGLCRIREKLFFIMDKNESIQRKNLILAECLSHMPHEDLYVVPAVRDLLTHGKRGRLSRDKVADDSGQPD